ncbi:MAG: transposase [Anaerolineales bacterium]
MSPRDRMERKLRTKRGWDLYCQRGWMVEGVLGQTKHVRDCDCLMRRGRKASKSEWKLIATTHNLLKLWRKTQAGRAAIGGLN